jgi:hypothetical protein
MGESEPEKKEQNSHHEEEEGRARQDPILDVISQGMRQRHIQWQIGRAAQVFSSQFPCKDAVISYIKSFKDPEDVETFLQISSFMATAKDSKPDAIGLIMLISVVERLARPKHKEFPCWLDDKEAEELREKISFPIGDFRGLTGTVSAAYEAYSDKQGSFRGFHALLDKHMTPDEKILVIKDIRRTRKKSFIRHYITQPIEQEDIEEYAREKNLGLEEGLMPGCYDWRSCWTEYAHCLAPDHCRLRSNLQALSDEFKAIARLLYTMRSEFVHAASMGCFIPKTENEMTPSLLCYVDHGFVHMDLDYTTFETIIINVVKRYFDERVEVGRSGHPV